jgi:hypothetical protein
VKIREIYRRDDVGVEEVVVLYVDTHADARTGQLVIKPPTSKKLAVSVDVDTVRIRQRQSWDQCTDNAHSSLRFIIRPSFMATSGGGRT